MDRIHNDIYIVRHGETDWNKQGKIQGHTDVPLNDEGKRQALQLKEKLSGINFTHIFSSDLLRAYQTAELIRDTGASDIIKTPHLRERTFAAWEGRLHRELKEHLVRNGPREDASKDEYISYTLDEGIESYADMYARVSNFIASVVSASSNGPILLVSHGGVVRSLLYTSHFKPGFRWLVENLAYLKLGLNVDGRLCVVESNGAKLVPVQDAKVSV